MLGFLKKLFGGEEHDDKSGGQEQQLMASEDLQRVESALEEESRGRQTARLLNRAGDLYLVKGERQNALKRYGDAIDAYLQAGEYDNAMAVCRKIIRVVPEVIRTRRTLAWLCLGKGFLEIAREHVEAYVDASHEAGLEALAAQQLQLMAQYVERQDFRDFLAQKLEELEEPDVANRVREGHASDAVRAGGWTPVVFAAMLTPEELRRAADRGVDLKAPGGSGEGDDFESLIFEFEPADEGRGKKDRSQATEAAEEESEEEEESESEEEAEGEEAEELEREASASGGESEPVEESPEEDEDEETEEKEEDPVGKKAAGEEGAASSAG